MGKGLSNKVVMGVAATLVTALIVGLVKVTLANAQRIAVVEETAFTDKDGHALYKDILAEFDSLQKDINDRPSPQWLKDRISNFETSVDVRLSLIENELRLRNLPDK